MASRSVISRKNSVSQARRLDHIVELVKTYFASVQHVQHSLSYICKILNQKKMLSPDMCFSSLNALEKMSKPLSSLCSSFEDLTFLPGALVQFHMDVFMALSTIQNQAKQVEAHIKRYYQYIISSKFQDMLELRPAILQLIESFRAQLKTGDILLKKALGQKDVQFQDIPPVAPDRGDGRCQTPVVPVTVVPDPSSNKSGVLVHQEESETLLNLESALELRRKHLSDLERQKATFADPRNISIDLTKQEELIQAEIKRLTSEISMEQSRLARMKPT